MERYGHDNLYTSRFQSLRKLFHRETTEHFSQTFATACFYSQNSFPKLSLIFAEAYRTLEPKRFTSAETASFGSIRVRSNRHSTPRTSQITIWRDSAYTFAAQPMP
jgi:hypothetical protein